MEPIHMTAKNLQARNEVEMGPDHMTAKKFHLEMRMERNHTIAKMF
jgi:hypothetical protein